MFHVWHFEPRTCIAIKGFSALEMRLLLLLLLSSDGRVSDATKLVIRRLLQLDSQMRMTASQVLDALGTIIAQW